MKRTSLAVLFTCCIFSAYADSNLIADKEIWEPGESTSPSAVGGYDYDDYGDDDDYYYDDDDEDYTDNWSKPKAPAGQSPSMFTPKGGKDVFPPEK